MKCGHDPRERYVSPYGEVSCRQCRRERRAKTLARLEAELAQPPPEPWTGAMVLPRLCRRGHPWDVYHQGRDCLRCKALLQRGAVLVDNSVDRG